MYIFLSIIILIIFIIGYIFINIKYKKLKKELTKFEIHSIPFNDYCLIAYFFAIITIPLIVISIILSIKNNMIGYWCCVGTFLFFQILSIIVNMMCQLYTEAFHKDKIYVFRISKNKVFSVDKIFYIRDYGLEAHCYDINLKKLFTLNIDNFKRQELIKKINHHHPILIISTGMNNYNNLDELFNRLDDVNKIRFIKIGKYLRENKEKSIKKVKISINITFILILL